jgi:hypothetical protein
MAEAAAAVEARHAAYWLACKTNVASPSAKYSSDSPSASTRRANRMLCLCL